MKYIFLIGLFVLTSFGICAQEPEEIPTGLPDIYPVSPQASSLGKYGNLPVNLSTGKLGLEIPITEINVGSFTYPISLTYDYSGFQVDPQTNTFGLGWRLNGLSMITRQVNKKPDEGGSGYLLGTANRFVIPFLNQEMTDKERVNFYKQTARGFLDTEPDKFIIATNGLRGNFYFNENYNPVFVPWNNYKLELSNNLSGDMRLTSDTGIGYTYNTKETTSYGNSSDQAYTYTSGWYLNVIDFPNSREQISFDYSYRREIKTTVSQTMKKRTDPTLLTCKSIRDFNVVVDHSATSDINMPILEQINFPEGSITFTYEGKFVRSIVVKDINQQQVEKFVFEYSDGFESYRTLKSIKKVQNSETLPYYSFDYNPVPETAVSPYAQDYWGYYNGSVGRDLINGNRAPNFETTAMGALTRVTYPTGGSTIIDYESNTIPNKQALGPPTITRRCDGAGYNDTYSLRITNPSGSTGSRSFRDSGSLFIEKGQYVNIDLLSLGRGRTGGIEVETRVGGSLRKSICTPAGSLSADLFIERFEPTTDDNVPIGGFTESERASGKFFAPSGSTISVSLSIEIPNAARQEATSSVTISYFNPQKDPRLVDKFFTVGGIRVKTTQDCFASEPCINKLYKYEDSKGFSSGMQLAPISNSRFFTIGGCRSCRIETVNSTSNVPLRTFQGSNILYGRVEILRYGKKLSDTIYGKTVRHFTGTPLGASLIGTQERKDWRRGNLERELTYKSNNGFKIVAETFTQYETLEMSKERADRNNYVWKGFDARQSSENYDFIPGRGCDRANITSTSVFSDTYYQYYPEFYRITQKQSTQYLAGEAVTSTTDYSYDDIGYLQKSRTVNSKGVTQERSYTYSYEERDSPLISANILSTPIQTDFKAGNSQSKKRITYKAWSGANLLPDSVSESIDNNSFEKYTIYYDYDNRGNPLEMSRRDGTRIITVWGYNKQYPIAQIVGASYIGITKVTQGLIDAAVAASNSEVTKADERNLIAQLQRLREAPYFKDAQVTTYTFDPLIGVSSITGPDGYTEYLEYDAFKRLEFVKDSEDNIMTQNTYLYKK